MVADGSNFCKSAWISDIKCPFIVDCPIQSSLKSAFVKFNNYYYLRVTFFFTARPFGFSLISLALYQFIFFLTDKLNNFNIILANWSVCFGTIYIRSFFGSVLPRLHSLFSVKLLTWERFGWWLQELPAQKWSCWLYPYVTHQLQIFWRQPAGRFALVQVQ